MWCGSPKCLRQSKLEQHCSALRTMCALFVATNKCDPKLKQQGTTLRSLCPLIESSINRDAIWTLRARFACTAFQIPCGKTQDKYFDASKYCPQIEYFDLSDAKRATPGIWTWGEARETGNPKQETAFPLAPPASPSFRLPVPSFRFRVTRPRLGTQNHRNKTQPCERSALLMLLTRNSKPETGNDQLASLSYKPNYCRYDIVCN